MFEQPAIPRKANSVATSVPGTIFAFIGSLESEGRSKEMNNTGGQDDFQIGQTAKARSGSPCAVTPQSDMTASASQGSLRRVFRVNKKFHRLIAAKTQKIAISLRNLLQNECVGFPCKLGQSPDATNATCLRECPSL